MNAKLFPEDIARAIARQAHEPGVPLLAKARLVKILTGAGYDTGEIAGLLGCEAGRVRMLRSFLKLPREGQVMLDTGFLPEAIGYYISLLSPANQSLMLARWRRGGFSSAAHAERYARTLVADEQGFIPSL